MNDKLNTGDQWGHDFFPTVNHILINCEFCDVLRLKCFNSVLTSNSDVVGSEASPHTDGESEEEQSLTMHVSNCDYSGC